MSKRKVEAVNEYFDNSLGCVVKVYPEKQVKRKAWMRGESFMGITQRVEADTGGMLMKFTRKHGKY